MTTDSRSMTTAVTTTRYARLEALDALRGLIMILMALDHANHFVAQQHSSGEYWGGPFPVYADGLSFLTRWLTHLAAPGFFFLMGAGMMLFADSRRVQGWSEKSIMAHFLVRGSFLIGLQLLIVNQAWALSPGGWALDMYIGVLFALGGTMILGSFLLRLERRWLWLLTAVFILVTQYLSPDPGQWNATFSLLNRLLLVPGGDLQLWVNYPVLPWLGLVTFGLAYGRWLIADQQRAYKRTAWLGAIFLLLFFVLRALNGFGNIRPQTGTSWIDFLNVVKYPPSLTFMLLTMGINLSLLWGIARTINNWPRFYRPFIVFGQVPLFFYIIHLFLYAFLGNWLVPTGTTLPVMYLYWLLGLLLLYPLCLGYGRFKRQRPSSLLLRLV